MTFSLPGRHRFWLSHPKPVHMDHLCRCWRPIRQVLPAQQPAQQWQQLAQSVVTLDNRGARCVQGFCSTAESLSLILESAAPTCRLTYGLYYRLGAGVGIEARVCPASINSPCMTFPSLPTVASPKLLLLGKSVTDPWLNPLNLKCSCRHPAAGCYM